jgi:N-acetylmuramoyl-L-alanine amidase
MIRLFICLCLFLGSLSGCSRPQRIPVERYPITKTIPLQVQRFTPPPVTYIPPQVNRTQPIGPKGLIVIDAGHGGKDFGTNSQSNPRYFEKHLTLSTTFMLRDYLQQMGYQVVLTRDKDVFIALSERAQMANEEKPLAFISVHYNHADSREAAGIEIYYYKSDENKLRTSESKQLAQSVLSKVIASTQAKSRGVKNANFAVIRETKMPAILIEGGFLSNEAEMDKIKKAAYLKQLAWGIATGLDDYTSQKG